MDSTAKIYTMIPDTVQAASNYIEKSGITKTKFAELINCNRSTLSLYLSGKYTGDITEMENKIIGFLKSVDYIQNGEYKTAAVQKSSFCITHDAANILGVCQSCQEYTALGVVIGRSGYGKTYSLKNYIKSNNRVCYVECDDSMGAKDLVKSIEKALGIPSSYGSIWDRVSRIKDFFNTCTGYLLVIDEADKLISKYTQKKAEILRTIFDQSDVGLVLAGEPNLEAMIKTFIPRLANRVDFYAKLGGVTRKEVEEYLDGYNFTEDSIKEMVVRASNAQTGCFRLLDRTLKNVLRLVDVEDEITIDTIRKASQMMML